MLGFKENASRNSISRTKNIKKIFWSPLRFYFIIFQKCRTREEKRKLNFSSISNYNSLKEYKKLSF